VISQNICDAQYHKTFVIQLINLFICSFSVYSVYPYIDSFDSFKCFSTFFLPAPNTAKTFEIDKPVTYFSII